MNLFKNQNFGGEIVGTTQKFDTKFTKIYYKNFDHNVYTFPQEGV